MSNPRIMVTLTAPLVDFLDHVKHETGQGYAVTLRNLAIFSREFADFRKDQARQAAETAKASTKTTVVVEARPTREDMLAEERLRQERLRQASVDPPWPTAPETKERRCHHGEIVVSYDGYTMDCIECAVEAGHEVCRKHTEVQPCVYCSMDEVGEAAP